MFNTYYEYCGLEVNSSEIFAEVKFHKLNILATTPICGHYTHQFFSHTQSLLACVDCQELVIEMATSI